MTEFSFDMNSDIVMKLNKNGATENAKQIIIPS